MTFEEVIEMIKSSRFANEYGFDLQTLVNAVGALGEMLRNGYTIAPPPRVMTLDEMNDKRGRGEVIYYEDRDATCKSQDVFVIALDKDLDVVWLKAETYTLAAKMSTMGKTWRCWTSRPDEKVRAETPWES